MAQNRCRKDIVGKRFLCVPATSASSNHQQINGHPTSLLPGLEPSRWAWRAGVIRAATHHSLEHPELQLLLEYDDQNWDQREWTNIHQTGVFHVFLIEHDLWWAQQSPSHHQQQQQQYQLWPALAFSSLVNRSRVTFRVARLIDGDICVDKDDDDLPGEEQPHQRFKTVSEATSGASASASGVDRNVDICDSEAGRKKQLPSHVRAHLDRSKDHNSTTGSASRKKGAQTNSASVVLIAVEFLLDQERAFLTPSKLRSFQDWESFGLASIGGGVGDWSQQKRKQQQKEEEDRLTADSVPAVKEAVRKWAELQAGQRILVTTPSVVVGYRCQVYRSEGATQWYTAVIVGHDEETGELTLTDDTVLEEHYEDPRLLQIKLLGEGVVESILRGETVGITSRRSRAASQAGKVYQLHQQQQQQQHHQHHQQNHQQVGGLSQAQQHPSTASSGNKRSGKEVRLPSATAIHPASTTASANADTQRSEPKSKVIRSPSKVSANSRDRKKKLTPCATESEDETATKSSASSSSSSSALEIDSKALKTSSSSSPPAVEIIPVARSAVTVAAASDCATSEGTVATSDSLTVAESDRAGAGRSGGAVVTKESVSAYSAAALAAAGGAGASAAAGGGLVIIPLPRSSTTSAAASTGAISGPTSSQHTQLQLQQHDRPYSSVISGASAAASSAAAAAAAAAAVVHPASISSGGMERERYEEEMRDRESAAGASLSRAGQKGSRSPASSPSGHGVGGNNLPNRSTPSSTSNAKRQSESTGAYSQPTGPSGVSGPGGGGLVTPMYMPYLPHPGSMPYSLQGQLPQQVAAEMYWKSLHAHAALNHNFMSHPSAAAAAAAAAAHAAAAHGVGQSHEELHLANERREREERAIREQRERERREIEAKEQQQLQRERERENWSKQAVDQHFEESLRKHQEQKRNRDGGGSGPSASASAATERQFAELQYHQDSVRLIKELEQRKREGGLSTMPNSTRASGGGSAVPPVVRSEADGSSSKQAVDQHFHESLRMRELIEQKKRESALPSGSSPWSLPRLQGDPMNKNNSALPTQAQLSLSAGPPSHNHNSGSQDKDNRERYMAAYNQVIERHAGVVSSGNGGNSSSGGRSGPAPPNSTSSNSAPPSGSSSGPVNHYTALPRADLNFAIQGYQTAPSPTSQGPTGSQPPQRKSEQSLNSSNSNHPLVADYSVKSGSSGGGVIVGPSDRMDRDPRDQLQQQQLQQIHQARVLDMQRMADLRDAQRGDPQQQRPPTVSYKPYESSPRSVNNCSSSGSGHVGNRTSRSPHSQMTPPTTTSSNYPNHYAGPGPGSQQPQHSYSPNPGGRNGQSVSYMPPPSVSPSRSPAAVVAASGPPAHSALYPAMRYSPAPQTTAPAPSTSPSDPNRTKKTSPSPLQQQQQHIYLNSGGSSSSRSSSNSGVSISSGPSVCRADQTTPLSLTTPAKSVTTIPYNSGVNESAPPPAHTARNEREMRDARDMRDVRLYPNTAFSPLAHPLPPPHLSVNSTARSGQPPVPLPIVVPQQQQPLDLGTYREDSPIPLISSARLSTADALGKKTRVDQQQAPPPPSIPHMPGYPSIGPTGFALGGAPLMSVAALIDAGFSTASVNKPQSNSASNAAAAYALTLSSRLPTCDTPPLLLQPNPSLPPMSHGAPSTEPRPVIVKNEPQSSTITPTTKATNISPPPVGNETDRITSTGIQNASRSPPVVVPEIKVKQEPVSQPLPPPPPNNNKNNANNSAKPVHKLKTAWLQRHTGGDDVVIKPTIDIKMEPMDRNSPGLAKPNARKAAASAGNIKTESINGYGSPQNANDDDSNTAGLRGGAGGNKRKSRGPAASSFPKDRDKRAKTSASAASSAASGPVQTPASSTGGSSSDDASESENDVNGVTGRQKKGGTAAKSSVARGVNALAGRQRNSDSSSSSKDGQPVRKGRGGAVTATGSNSKPVILPVNPFNKPPIQSLKKSGQSFLQDLPCWEIAPRLSKCRECRLTPHQRRRNEQQQTNANIFCRFYAFRRLRYTKNSQIAIAGFSDPVQDASEDDLKLWLPTPEKASVQESEKTSSLDLDAEMAIFLLTHAGDQFCYMVQTEKEAKTEALASVTEDGDPLKIAWKRVVQGVREMCDVCETTLFNFHWACGKCGYVVCIDCYKSRRAAKSPHNGNGTSGKDDEKEEKDKDRDSYGWLLCTSRSGHDPDKLMPTQIIAGKALECMGHLVHLYRRQHSIIQFCDCPEAIESNKAIEAAAAVNSEANGTNGSGDSNGICKNPIAVKADGVPNGDVDNKGNGTDAEGSKPVNGNQTPSAAGDAKSGGQSASSPFSVLVEVALSKEKKTGKTKNGYGKAEGVDGTATANGADGDLDQTTSDEENGEHFSTLRELLIRPAPKTVTKTSDQAAPPVKRPRMETLEDVISCVIERGVDREASAGSPISNPPPVSADSVPVPVKENVNTNGETEEVKEVEPLHFKRHSFKTEEVKEVELLHFKRHAFKTPRTRGMLPVRIMIMADSERAYPGVPHSWLCNGRLLQLHDPSNPGNSQLFQDSWRRGQPVLVSGVSKLLDQSIWHPDSFLKEFGDDKNDLINCLTGNLVPNQPMKKFWEGFERLTKRLKDEKGQPMLLKLKDWPPGEDFAEVLPDRFSDLMKALPLSDYTHRSGRLNLAGRLPECFVRPDLGPKMYNAYGSALLCTKGTTNLHLDVSDAANVMVYIGLPKEANSEEHIKEAIKAVEDSGCDFLTRQRIEKGGEIPGALWHIYQASDADKIRDFLNKVAVERGDRLEIHNDPIHDQSWYLDGELRGRLYKEYGVSGYPIVQCLGDTIFIPAGAPHQVRNLHSCIKVAEDFVSPETVAHCFQMTQEFRHLSDSHTNHEDKLQIKNIIYHAMKDSIAALAHAKNVTFPDLLRVYDSFITG